MSDTEELNESELGTLEQWVIFVNCNLLNFKKLSRLCSFVVMYFIYFIFFICSWEKIYDEEINNFQEYGDVGEIWFGKNNAFKLIK